jgi:ribonuclease HIII
MYIYLIQRYGAVKTRTIGTQHAGTGTQAGGISLNCAFVSDEASAFIRQIKSRIRDCFSELRVSSSATRR